MWKNPKACRLDVALAAVLASVTGGGLVAPQPASAMLPTEADFLKPGPSPAEIVETLRGFSAAVARLVESGATDAREVVAAGERAVAELASARRVRDPQVTTRSLDVIRRARRPVGQLLGSLKEAVATGDFGPLAAALAALPPELLPEARETGDGG